MSKPFHEYKIIIWNNIPFKEPLKKTFYFNEQSEVLDFGREFFETVKGLFRITMMRWDPKSMNYKTIYYRSNIDLEGSI